MAGFTPSEIKELTFGPIRDLANAHVHRLHESFKGQAGTEQWYYPHMAACETKLVASELVAILRTFGWETDISSGSTVVTCKFPSDFLK